MLFFTILLVAIIIAFVLLMVFKKEWVMSIFGNSITGKVERKKRIEGEIEVLKKQEKVECERVLKDFQAKREQLENDTNAEIARLKSEINRLNTNRDAQLILFDEQQKVMLDETIYEFDRKIVNKTNKAKKLGYLVEAEQKNIEDVINPAQPNAPKAPVVEATEVKSIKRPTTKKTTAKKSK